MKDTFENKATPVWKSKDGPIPITDMTDDHVFYTCAHLCRMKSKAECEEEIVFCDDWLDILKMEIIRRDTKLNEIFNSSPIIENKNIITIKATSAKSIKIKERLLELD